MRVKLAGAGVGWIADWYALYKPGGIRYRDRVTLPTDRRGRSCQNGAPTAKRRSSAGRMWTPGWTGIRGCVRKSTGYWTSSRTLGRADVVRDLNALHETTIVLDGQADVVRSGTKRTVGKVFQACGVAIPPALRPADAPATADDAAVTASRH